MQKLQKLKRYPWLRMQTLQIALRTHGNDQHVRPESQNQCQVLLKNSQQNSFVSLRGKEETLLKVGLRLVLHDIQQNKIDFRKLRLTFKRKPKPSQVYNGKIP